jgi:hypothetical protein
MWKKILSAAKSPLSSRHIQSNSETKAPEENDALTDLPSNVEEVQPKPANAGSTLKFLQDRIGADRVVLNEVTGRPCLYQPYNNVLYAVRRGGGVKKVAENFGLPEWMVGKWIDDHYVPDMYARKLALLTGYGEFDVQHAPIGYLDPENRFCWPPSYYVTVTEKTFAMALGKVRKQQERQEQQAKVDAASAGSVTAPTPQTNFRPRSLWKKLTAWFSSVASNLGGSKVTEVRAS